MAGRALRLGVAPFYLSVLRALSATSVLLALELWRVHGYATFCCVDDAVWMLCGCCVDDRLWHPSVRCQEPVMSIWMSFWDPIAHVPRPTLHSGGSYVVFTVCV